MIPSNWGELVPPGVVCYPTIHTASRLKERYNASQPSTDDLWGQFLLYVLLYKSSLYCLKDLAQLSRHRYGKGVQNLLICEPQRSHGIVSIPFNIYYDQTNFAFKSDKNLLNLYIEILSRTIKIALLPIT